MNFKNVIRRDRQALRRSIRSQIVAAVAGTQQDRLDYCLKRASDRALIGMTEYGTIEIEAEATIRQIARNFYRIEVLAGLHRRYAP